jgi:hypothetical protein
VHDNHEPTCALCRKFALPFDEQSPLVDWGYCRKELAGREPTPEQLEEIEEQVRKGDYRFLSEGKVPLYEALGEGCDDFEDTGHH